MEKRQVESHVNLLGILWIVSGALGLLFALFVFFFFFGISFIPDMDMEGEIILRTLAIIGAIFFLVLSIPEIIAGWWLMKKKEWARIFVLVLAFLNILSFPFGTALAIYSMIILFKPEAADVFER